MPPTPQHSKKKTTKATASKKPTTKKAPAKRPGTKKITAETAPATGNASVAAAAALSKLERQQSAAREFAIAAARMIADDKCREVVVIDVRGRSQVTDFMVIGTGTSDRQMRAAGEHVDALGGKTGMKLYRHTLRDADTKWVLLDFVDVVVHVFEPDARLYYDLEMLWGDAPRVAWERPMDIKSRAAEGAMETEMTRDRAGLRRGRAG
ncbi:MAG: ribosome silencing factor [Phycisphaerales bacterium]